MIVKSKGITQRCADFIGFRADPSIVLDMVQGNLNAAAKVFCHRVSDEAVEKPRDYLS